MPRQVRRAVLVSYAAFILIGVSAGVSGVLLPSQMASYGVDRATIGILFFASSAGYFLGSVNTGALIGRLGLRTALAAVGGGTYVLAGLYLAVRPPFAAFLLAQLVAGYGCGVLESGLNVYLAALPGATTRLNRLHAFFGVGALLGPPLGTWIVGFTSWTEVYLVLAVAFAALAAGFLATFPATAPRAPEPAAPGPARPAAPAPDAPAPVGGAPAGGAPAGGGETRAALRDRGVLLGSAMLAVYVGVELSVGNWGFSYLVQGRALPQALAGYTVSGYWLGLTLGRFLISPLAARVGATTAGMMYACLAGVTAATALAWLLPTAPACVALGLVGFFLGPVFPTTMAVASQLTRPRLVPAAIGIMNAASTVGGSALPWLAGAIAQSAGMRALLPFVIVLSLAQFAVWRPIAVRLRTPAEPPSRPAVSPDSRPPTR
jgi:fucose permease